MKLIQKEFARITGFIHDTRYLIFDQRFWIQVFISRQRQLKAERRKTLSSIENLPKESFGQHPVSRKSCYPV